MALRLLVFGPRDWNNYNLIVSKVGDFVGRTPHTEITLVEGEATGADLMSKKFFLQQIEFGVPGLSIDSFPANWSAVCPDCQHHRRLRKDGKSTYCPAQGVLRNQRMLDSGIDYAICFSWHVITSGTGDMLDRLMKAGFEEGKNLETWYGEKS